MAVKNDFNMDQEMKPLSKFPLTLDDISDEAGLIMKKKHFNCLCVFGQTVYIGTRNSKLYIYEFDGEKLVNEKVIIPHCQIVSSITATHKYFVSVPESDDQSVVSIWQASTRVFLTALKGHKSQVSKVLFLKDDGYVATSSWDGFVKVWYLDINFANQEQFRSLNAGGYPILTLEQDNKRDILILGGDDCYLTFWNWKKDEKIGKVFGHAGSVTFISSFSPFVLTGGGDNKFKVLECKSKVIEEDLMMADDSNNQQLPNEPKQKYEIEINTEIKKQYDSNLFSVLMENDETLIMDRQGNMFIFSKTREESITFSGNEFSYNESVTGLSRFGKFLFVTTTKGAVKVFIHHLQK